MKCEFLMIFVAAAAKDNGREIINSLAMIAYDQHIAVDFFKVCKQSDSWKSTKKWKVKEMGYEYYT